MNESLEALLQQLGCPPEKCPDMAAQLEKRARQLSERQHCSYEEALAHLLGLLRQGWAAQQRAGQDEPR